MVVYGSVLVLVYGILPGVGGVPLFGVRDVSGLVCVGFVVYVFYAFCVTFV